MFCLAGVVLATSGHFNTWRAVGAGALFGLGFQCKLWFAALFIIPLLIVFLFGSPDGKRLALFVIGSAAVVGSLVLLVQDEQGFCPHVATDCIWDRGLHSQSKESILADVPDVGRNDPCFISVSSQIRNLPVSVCAAVGGTGSNRSCFTLSSYGTCRIPIRTVFYSYLSSTGESAGGTIARTPAVGYCLDCRPDFDPDSIPLDRMASPGDNDHSRLGDRGGVYRTAERLPLRYHDLGYRQIVSALRPRMENFPADRVTYLAPEKPAFPYYMFRNGKYWGTPISPWTAERRELMAGDEEIRAFVIDPTVELYGGWPDSLTLEILQKSTREITSEIEEEAGRKMSLRVFVRETE